MEALQIPTAAEVPIHLPPGTEDVIKESNSTLKLAELMTVDDADSYVMAQESVIEWKDKVKDRKEYFAPMKESTYRAWKSVCAKENEAVDPYEKAIKLVDAKAMRWKKQEDDRVAEAEARQKEIDRKEAEDRQIAEAARLEALGEKEQAQKVLDLPPDTARAPMPSTVPKVQGSTPVSTWDFTVTNPILINRSYVAPDLVKIRAQVKALGKEAEQLVGGISVFKVESSRRVRS